MISLAPVLGFSVLGIPSGDTQNTSDLGTGVPKTRGYPNHCDTGSAMTLTGLACTTPVSFRP